MTRKRKKTIKKSMGEKGKKSIVDFIVSNKEFITIILGVSASLYAVANTVYKIKYQSECEKFYGIPGKYFDSNIDNRLLYLCCIIILLLISIAPAFMKKYYEKRENLTKGYLMEAVFLSIVIGMEIGLFNVYNLIEIMKQTYKTNHVFGLINEWLDNHAYFTITIVVALGSVSVLGISLIDKVRNIKWNWIKNAVCFILSVSLVASILVMLYGTMFKLSISIEDKTKYEFVTYDDYEYVILSSYDKINLIVPFDIDENGQCILKTSQYLFSKQYEGIYQYRDIKYRPRIEN